MHSALWFVDQRRHGLRQLLAVHFAACEHGQRRNDIEKGRDHVDRQPAAQRGEQAGAIHGRFGPVGDDVGSETGEPVAVVNVHGCGRHAGLLAQHRFDFRQFDPVAADLDLVVDPAEELDLAFVVDDGEDHRSDKIAPASSVTNCRAVNSGCLR